MNSKHMTRRELLRLSGVLATGTALAACKPQIVEKVVKETIVVEKEVEKVVKETVVVKEEVEVEKEVTRVVEKVAEAKPVEREAAEIVVMYQRNEFSEEEQAIFEEKYAPYKVQYLDNDLTKLMAMLAAGNPIDLFRIYGINTPAYVTRRIPKDLTDYFETSTKVPPADLMPVNDIFAFHGRRYGMVKDWSPDFSIFINKSIFEEMGVSVPSPEKSTPYKTWRELSSKLTKKEGDRTLIMGTDFTPHTNPLLYMSTTFDPPTHLFNDDFSKIVLRDNPNTYEAAKFWLEWMKEGGLPSSINPSPTGSWSGQDWRQRQAAAVQWGYWFSGMAVSETVPGEDIVMLPAPAWGPTYSNPCTSGCGAYITAATRVPDAVWCFFEWFMAEEPAEARAKSGWGVPGLKSLLPLMPQEEPWRQQTFEIVNWERENSALATTTWTPYIETAPFTTAWSKYRKSYLEDEITLDEMLGKVEEEVNEAMKEGMERAGVL